MKTNARWNGRFIAIIAALLSVAIVSAAAATTPQYQIYDIGVIDIGDTASQGFSVSHGGIAVGRSIRTGGSQAFSWTLNGGIIGLSNLAGRSHAVSNSANDSGVVVGTAASTLFGSSRLPVIWQNGSVSQLSLPPGETLGDANSVNAANVAVGSVDAGSLQRGAVYSGGSGTIITQTTANGSFFVTAFDINDSGRVVGQGIDPNKVKLAQTFGASKGQLLTKVVLPGSVPTFIAALKVNAGLSLVGVVVGEFQSASLGLGYLIQYGSQIFKMNIVMTAITILAVFSSVMYLAISWLEAAVMRRR